MYMYVCKDEIIALSLLRGENMSLPEHKSIKLSDSSVFKARLYEFVTCCVCECMYVCMYVYMYASMYVYSIVNYLVFSVFVSNTHTHTHTNIHT